MQGANPRMNRSRALNETFSVEDILPFFRELRAFANQYCSIESEKLI